MTIWILGKWQTATIETYRGCPYRCTFCDWGSNIASRIRAFDLQRVYDEIEWLAKREVSILWIADSNFGMTDRDLEITRKVCEVRQRLGFPKAMVLTFAKNIKSRVVDIVQMMVDADLIGTGIVSLQTIDPETLKTVRRTNIKTSEYEKLRNTFAARNLPLNVELIMALPGSTIEAFKRDLAYHFDLPIEVSVNHCIVLTNSPMADPIYRREHRIECDDEGRVTQTATMSSADIKRAPVICRVFYGVHRFGILRYLFRWLQWEKGINPLDVMDDLVREPPGDAEYPLLAAMVHDAHIGTPFDLATALAAFRDMMRKGSSWTALSSQFISWVYGRCPLPEDKAFNDLGLVQGLVMPSAGRLFPHYVTMRNDVVSWYSEWQDGKGSPLSTYGPGVLKVDDPNALSDRPCLESAAAIPGNLWELDFPLIQVRRDSAKSFANVSVERPQGDRSIT